MRPCSIGTTFSPAGLPKTNAHNNGPSLNLKVKFLKSTKEILFGEATDEFFDFLCSFLTTPIGSMIHVLEGQSGLKCMDNLYKSVVLLDQKWFRSPEKCGLLHPSTAEYHTCKKQPLKFDNNHFRSIYAINPKGSSNNFATKPSEFLVPVDLAVKPLSTFLLLQELKIPLRETEVQCITVGIKEALSLLKAA
ncbi:unnamed protein product, partial [Cuscuta europaea]